MIMTMAHTPVRVEDSVDLRVPAAPAYLAVVRTATAGLAARLNFTLDDIEDLRIAVDEACVLLLGDQHHTEAELRVSFTITTGLEILITGPAIVDTDQGSFAWSVLEALAGQVHTGRTTDGSWIRLYHFPQSVTHH